MPDYNPLAPIDGAKEALTRLINLGLKVIIYSSRPWSEYNIIEDFMNKFSLPFNRIICGKPLFKFVIDDRNISFKGNWKMIIDEIEK
jgi:cobalamin biosynthesis Co2+ chelatase CbiK